MENKSLFCYTLGSFRKIYLMKTAFSGKFFAYFKEIWFLWLLCFVINIITFLAVFYKIHPGNRTLALQYNVLVGVEWYGKARNLYFIPGIGLAISLVNLFLYGLLKDNKNFLSFLAVFVSVVVQLILLSAVLFLSAVN
jgi:hypothetical protein